jgi:hypothetical protein
LQILAEENRLPSFDEYSQANEKDANSTDNTTQNTETSTPYQHLKSLSEMVLASVFSKAIAGSATHQKLWFQLVENWAAPKAIPQKNVEESDAANYISINLKPFLSQLPSNGN